MIGDVVLMAEDEGANSTELGDALQERRRCPRRIDEHVSRLAPDQIAPRAEALLGRVAAEVDLSFDEVREGARGFRESLRVIGSNRRGGAREESLRRAQMLTLAPSRASRSAQARPIPSLPPVTMATFPPSPRSSILSSVANSGRRPALRQRAAQCTPNRGSDPARLKRAEDTP